MNYRLILVFFIYATLTASTGRATDSIPHRIVVIGDIHADVGAARAAFQLAGAANHKDEWIGGELVVVQLGDLIGRSHEDREVLDYVLGMREKAASIGGQVHVLIGNHELFGARLRVDYVAVGAYSAFDDISGLDLEHPRLSHLPEHQRARGAALMSGGHYAKRLAEFPAVLRIADTIYVHGGITPHWANYGVDRINEELSQWLAGDIDEPASVTGVDAGNPDDNVMMSRHFSVDVTSDDCRMLEESLEILGVQRMVVAHSVQESITVRCEGKVWAVDVGMSRYYGGKAQVLEIIDDREFSIINN